MKPESRPDRLKRENWLFAITAEIQTKCCLTVVSWWFGGLGWGGWIRFLNLLLMKNLHLWFPVSSQQKKMGSVQSPWRQMRLECPVCWTWVQNPLDLD